MESRVSQAEKLHQAGYNCAQAVICTYSDLLGIDEESGFRMAEAFGLGMGTQDTCGALTAALMLAGLQNSGGTEQAGKTKAATYQLARELTQEFEEHVGSKVCREIKTPPVKCSCGECVAHACRMVEERLLTKA